MTTTTATPPDLEALTLTALCDHIEVTHHVYLRRALPVLWDQVHTVRDVHGGRQPRLAELTAVFEALVADMDAHMQKEEQILFPMIRTLDKGGERAEFHCGTIANPIRVMEMEHDGAAAALQQMRALTDGYQPPAGACTTYRAMLAGLSELERDMGVHVHTENNLLFPRALQREARGA